MCDDDIIPEGYTRVSDVLKPFRNFSMISPEVLENAALRGEKVHKYCELYASNMLFEDVSKECEGYVKSFKEWFDSNNVKPLYMEKRLNCPENMITGRFDMIAMINDEYYLIDLKTSAKPSLAWDLQLAAYKMLIFYYMDIVIKYRMTIMLSKTGKKARSIVYEDDNKKIDMFLNALELYRFFEKE